MNMKVDFKATLMIAVLCGLVSTFATGSTWADELAQEISVGFNGSLTSPVSLPKDTSFGLIFDTVSVEGQVSIEGTDFNQSLSSNHGTVEGGPFQVTLEPGEYILTETYSGHISSSNSLIGLPSVEVGPVTFEHLISITEVTTCSIEVYVMVHDLIPELQGPFAVVETIVPGPIEDVIGITIVAAEDIQQGQQLEYTAEFKATVTSNTTIVKASQDEPTDPGSDSEGENPDTGDNLNDNIPTDPPGRGDKPGKDDRPSGPPEHAKAVVRKPTTGMLHLGPMPLVIDLPEIYAHPIDITAELYGDWRGRGTHVITPSGVEAQSLQVHSFKGMIEVSHGLEGLPTPIRLALHADSGTLTRHSFAIDSLSDIFLRTKSLALYDPATDAEILWPVDLLGPMPNMIKIKDGELQFIKSTGSAHEAETEAQDAANSAAAAADDADRSAAAAANKPTKEAQQLARQATRAAKQAAERAKKAARDAERAAEQAAQSSDDAESQQAAQRAQAAAENAQAAAERAENAAKRAGKEATDINDDGQNNILDLVHIANVFGTRVSVELGVDVNDVNGDDEINIFDLILVAQGLSGGVLIPDIEPQGIAAGPSLNIIGQPQAFLRVSEAVVDDLDNTVRLSVEADVSDALYAYEFELTFDENALEIVAVEEGELLSRDGALTFWDTSSSSKGRVHAIGTRVASDGISDSGKLATITLKLKSADVDVSDSISSATVKFSDVDGQTIHSQLRLGGIDLKQVASPSRSALFQNYPNPFNPETWLPYQLDDASDVIIRIYDAGGQSVHTLNLGLKASGYHVKRSKAAYWDGRNDAGESVASGVYFYTIQAGEFSETRKMIIMK